MLAERTECDVRSCLNTLQFLGRRQKSVRTADVAHTQTGQKDISRNAFAVWQELFWQRVRSLLRPQGSRLRVLGLRRMLFHVVPPWLRVNGL